jgi:hypothetical protein
MRSGYTSQNLPRVLVLQYLRPANWLHNSFIDLTQLIPLRLQYSITNSYMVQANTTVFLFNGYNDV